MLHVAKSNPKWARWKLGSGMVCIEIKEEFHSLNNGDLSFNLQIGLLLH